MALRANGGVRTKERVRKGGHKTVTTDFVAFNKSTVECKELSGGDEPGTIQQAKARLGTGLSRVGLLDDSIKARPPSA